MSALRLLAAVIPLLVSAQALAAPTSRLHLIDHALTLADRDRDPMQGAREGGVLDTSTRQALCLILGVLLGFGTGHLLAHDQRGFILFLVIDVAVIAALIVLDAIVQTELVYGLTVLGFLVERVVQGLDAYGAAGGQRILERERDNTFLVASNPVHRTFAISF